MLKNYVVWKNNLLNKWKNKVSISNINIGIKYRYIFNDEERFIVDVYIFVGKI